MMDNNNSTKKSNNKHFCSSYISKVLLWALYVLHINTFNHPNNLGRWVSVWFLLSQMGKLRNWGTGTLCDLLKATQLASGKPSHLTPESRHLTTTTLTVMKKASKVSQKAKLRWLQWKWRERVICVLTEEYHKWKKSNENSTIPWLAANGENKPNHHTTGQERNLGRVQVPLKVSFKQRLHIIWRLIISRGLHGKSLNVRVVGVRNMWESADQNPRYIV